MEILTDRQFRVVLDMTPGPGSDRAKSELDTLLKNLAALDDSAAAAAATDYHLTVTDIHSGEKFVWLAR